jgi:acetate CoA/acetoacetate CoA-transferase alpha subunit
MIRRLITTHIGLNPETQRQVITGEIEAEFYPQGTLAERIRAGGFGLGGILTPTSIDTVVEIGKLVIEVDGRPYLLKKPLPADFALIAAHRSDYWGNPEYSLTARNFNPVWRQPPGPLSQSLNTSYPSASFPRMPQQPRSFAFIALLGRA